jgi:hypothetical protein
MRLLEQLVALEDRTTATPAGPAVEEEYARLRTELEDTRKERDSRLTVMHLMGQSAVNMNQTTDKLGPPTPSFAGSKK